MSCPLRTFWPSADTAACLCTTAAGAADVRCSTGCQPVLLVCCTGWQPCTTSLLYRLRPDNWRSSMLPDHLTTLPHYQYLCFLVRPPHRRSYVRLVKYSRRRSSCSLVTPRDATVQFRPALRAPLLCARLYKTTPRAYR